MYHIELDPRVEVEISEDKECQFVPPDDYALDVSIPSKRNLIV